MPIAIAPVLTNLDGDRVTFTQGQGPVFIDAAGTGTDNHGMAPVAAGLSDADSADFDGGNLTVSVAAGAVAAEDLLTLDTSGTVALSGTTAGATVSVGGTVIGTLVNDIAAGNDLVVSFNANATASLVSTLVHSVQYENTNTAGPDTGLRTIRVTVDDGDGAVSANNDVTVGILQSGSAEFTDSGQTLGSSNSRYVTMGDVDGDGDLDVLVANSNQANRVYLNDGSGTFVDSGQALGTADSWGVVLGDVDNDGDLDAFVTNRNAGNRVWLNDGTGVYTDSGQSLGTGDSRAVAFGDVDGDGDLDAVVANYGQANRVWLNNGAGTFTDSGQALGTSQTLGITLGDVDGDGDLDMFTANANQADRVWINDGSGTFTDSGQTLGTSYGSNVVLGDLDGDGDLDAFVTNWGQPNTVWLNDGTGTYTDSGQALGNSRSNGVMLGDLDGDGDLDAFVANNIDGNRVWLNDGSAVFSEGGLALGSDYAIGVALGDIDADGDLDAYVANDLGSNRVWVNIESPAISELASDTAGFVEGFGPVILDQAPGAVVVDGDSADFDTGTLTVSIVAGGHAAEDVLAIRNEGTGAGQIGISGGTVTWGGVAIGTWTGGTGGAALVITFNASATPAAAEALIRNITYDNPGNDVPTPGDRTVRFTLTDGDGGSSGDHDVVVTVTGVNDAPVFTGLDAALVAQASGAAVVMDNDVTIADAELDAAGSYAGASITIQRQGGADAGDIFGHSGTLETLTEGGSLTVGGTVIGTVTANSAGTLTLTFEAAATASLVNDALRQVTFRNTGNDTSAVTLDWTFSDGNSGAQGTGGAGTASGSISVTLAIFTAQDDVVDLNDYDLSAFPGQADGLAGNDVVVLSETQNIGTPFSAGVGNDTVTGSGSGDVINGDAGNDVLVGRGGDDTLSGGDGNDTVRGGSGADVLSGGAGFDTLNYADSTAAVQVFLGGNTASGGDAAGDTISGFENLVGSNFDDRLYGSAQVNLLDGGAGNDILLGNNGNDTLRGRAGRDILYGGNDADVFVYLSMSDSGQLFADRDRIQDFTDGEDRFDLSALDANAGLGGDQAFTFVGRFFSGTAGELRAYEYAGLVTILEGDVDGDRVADFRLEVLGTGLGIDASDFIL
ncbi:beta strand repeat-containing protein [Zhengella sp. ZM62]|uniref:beta strand repeat-containing protein n=1 Tax=Zhengella sedimenti TaxID=3390035 RepID=UPI0039766BE0